MIKTALSFLLCVIVSSTQANTILSGSKTISLIGNDGKPFKIGEIVFANQGQKINYTIDLNASEFSSEFLSMRPFICLRFDNKMLCHLPYLYEKKSYITRNDLVDLEYDLLFLHKTADEFGINAWNGLYYDLKITEKGLEGVLKEVDLNILSAPPEEGNRRPITEDMLHEADPEQHLFPRLVIE